MLDINKISMLNTENLIFILIIYVYIRLMHFREISSRHIINCLGTYMQNPHVTNGRRYGNKTQPAFINKISVCYYSLLQEETSLTGKR